MVIYFNGNHYGIATSVAMDYSPGRDIMPLLGGLLEQKPLVFKQEQRTT